MTVPLPKIKPPVKVKILLEEGLDYLGFAKNKLALLTANRERLNLPVLKSPIIFIEDIWIKLVSSVWGDEILIGGEAGIRGFLFHPRTGPVSVKGVLLESGGYKFFSYINGPGWNPKGDLLKGDILPYPQLDDDHGTRNIEYSSTQEKWLYNNDPPENYGNIDWKGPNTAKSGDPSNAPILTWKGPPSRYFAEAMYHPVTGQFYYGPCVYQGGAVIGTMPCAADGVPYYVTGAAIAADQEGKKWLVATAREYSYEESPSGGAVVRCHFKVVVQPFGCNVDKWYHEKDAPAGWRTLLDYNDNVYTPFFFNASGTEGSTVRNWAIFTITVNVDKMKATLSVNDQNQTVFGNGSSGTNGTSTWDNGSAYMDGTGEAVSPLYLDYNGYYGQRNYGNESCGTRNESITRVVAIDYDGDKKIEATINNTLYMYNGSITNVHITKTKTPDPLYRGSPHWTHVTQDNYASRNHSIYSETFKFNGVSVPIARIEGDAFNKYIYRSHAHNSYDNPAVNILDIESSSGEYYTDNGSISSIMYGAIVFADLRHNIVVVGKRKQTSRQSQLSSRSVVNSTGSWILLPDSTIVENPPATHSIEVDGVDKATIPFAETTYFIITDNDAAMYPALPGWPSISGDKYSYVVSNVHFRFCNQPIGSWAVDRDGNHFYSMLVDKKVYNYLTNGEPVSLTETVGPNPVFFPIAPV